MIFWGLALILAIAVHAAGRLLAALVLRLPVIASLGFAGKLASARRGEVEYRLGYVPLGLFVRVDGAAAVWRQLALIPAGSVFVFGLAFGIVFSMARCSAPSHLRAPVIGTVLRGDPAERAGLRPGDRIVAVAGAPTRSWSDLQREIGARPEQRCSLRVKRGDAELTLEVTPQAASGDGPRVGRIGISPRLRTTLIEPRPGSPAARGGMQTGDLITSVEGVGVEHWSELEARLASRRAGALRVDYKRLAPMRELAQWDAEDPDFAARLQGTPQRSATLERPAGAVTPATLGLEPGDLLVRVVTRESAAEDAGLLPGDRLLAIDGQEIAEWESLLVALLSSQNASHRLTVRSPAAQPREVVLGPTVAGKQIGLWTWSFVRVAPREPLDSPAAHAAVVASTVIRAIIEGWISALGGAPRSRFGSTGEHEGNELAWHATLALAQGCLLVALLSLLPLPGVPGSELVLLLIEAVRRRPLSVRVRSVASALGASLFLLAAAAFAVWLLMVQSP